MGILIHMNVDECVGHIDVFRIVAENVQQPHDHQILKLNPRLSRVFRNHSTPHHLLLLREVFKETHLASMMDSSPRKRKRPLVDAEHHGGDGPKHGEWFESKIFIVTVGADQKEYTVHGGALKKSPVFAAMCEADFQEAHSRRINLPEDDSASFGALIQYLYTRDFATKENPVSPSTRLSSAMELASLYVAAEKYQLDALKTLVVKKFAKTSRVAEPAEWLPAAEVVYASIPDSDEIFPVQLRSMILTLLASIHGNLPDSASAVLNQSLGKGGRLAIDINGAMMTYWKEKGPKETKLLRKKFEKKLKQQNLEHGSRHRKCRSCATYHCTDFTDAEDEMGLSEQRDEDEDEE